MASDKRNPAMTQIEVFNPDARLEVMQFGAGRFCLVIDDALTDPGQLATFAVGQRSAFRAVDFNAYPGNYLAAPTAIADGLNSFFNERLRRRFDARRTLHAHCRLSMVTLAPQLLRPYQWLCHRDSEGIDSGQCIQACVLYLFQDESLGGTSFYEPARPAAEIAALFGDATRLSAEQFAQRYGIQPGYMHESNTYFTRMASVPARWNRLIFYDGSMLHSGDIIHPEKLSDDPASGRLTLNGFFTCKRNAA
jgi:Family of unknown function (DUF6445)